MKDRFGLENAATHGRFATVCAPQLRQHLFQGLFQPPNGESPVTR